MSSVVSAGFPFVVKVEILPPLWRGNVVFAVLGKLSVGYVAMCCAFLGRALDRETLGSNFV